MDNFIISEDGVVDINCDYKIECIPPRFFQKDVKHIASLIRFEEVYSDTNFYSVVDKNIDETSLNYKIKFDDFSYIIKYIYELKSINNDEICGLFWVKTGVKVYVKDLSKETLRKVKKVLSEIESDNRRNSIDCGSVLTIMCSSALKDIRKYTPKFSGYAFFEENKKNINAEYNKPKFVLKK